MSSARRNRCQSRGFLGCDPTKSVAEVLPLVKASRFAVGALLIQHTLLAMLGLALLRPPPPVPAVTVELGFRTENLRISTRISHML